MASTTDFHAKDGHTYRIEIDDCGEEISVSEGDRDLGNIILRMIEVDDTARFDYYKITHLALKAPQGLGIATRCLEYHKEVCGMPIEAKEHDGIVRDDGSHLTEDGPGFIEAMRKKGIVRGGENSAPDDLEDDA